MDHRRKTRARARARMKEMVARLSALSLPEEKEERIHAIDAITPSFSSHVRIGHKRDTRASSRSPFPGNYFISSLSNLVAFHDVHDCSIENPNMSSPIDTTNVFRGFPSSFGRVLEFKGPPVHARAYPVTRYQASTEEDGRINPIKRTTVDRFVVDFVNSIISVSNSDQPRSIGRSRRRMREIDVALALQFTNGLRT